jgi:hypothetical protein
VYNFPLKLYEFQIFRKKSNSIKRLCWNNWADSEHSKAWDGSPHVLLARRVACTHTRSPQDTTGHPSFFYYLREWKSHPLNGFFFFQENTLKSWKGTLIILRGKAVQRGRGHLCLKAPNHRRWIIPRRHACGASPRGQSLMLPSDLGSCQLSAEQQEFISEATYKTAVNDEPSTSQIHRIQ